MLGTVTCERRDVLVCGRPILNVIVYRIVLICESIGNVRTHMTTQNVSKKYMIFLLNRVLILIFAVFSSSWL